jgi:hypothetical protein
MWLTIEESCIVAAHVVRVELEIRSIWEHSVEFKTTVKLDGVKW